MRRPIASAHPVRTLSWEPFLRAINAHWPKYALITLKRLCVAPRAIKGYIGIVMHLHSSSSNTYYNKTTNSFTDPPERKKCFVVCATSDEYEDWLWGSRKEGKTKQVYKMLIPDDSRLEEGFSADSFIYLPNYRNHPHIKHIEQQIEKSIGIWNKLHI